MDDALRALYQEVILDHNKRPHNRHEMADASSTSEGFNPLCGDFVKVFLKTVDGIVEDASFEGHGCAISIASASLLSEAVRGKSVADAEALFDAFQKMVTGQGDPLDGELGALAGVAGHPVRIKCAALSMHAFRSALRDGKAVTTE